MHRSPPCKPRGRRPRMDKDHHGGGGIVPLKDVNIQKIILERKEERRLEAEQKRQVDLQRIRDMRSTTGIHPLELFPKEIWIMIINELDANDQASFWKMHEVFRGLMKDGRVEDILFPLALNVKNLISWIKRVEKREDEESIQSLPFERLRNVSKTMKNSFDRWMEGELNKFMQDQSGLIDFEYIDYFEHRSYVNLDSASEQSLESLISSFQGEISPRRFLCVEFTSERRRPTLEMLNQMNAKLTTLLNTFGDQIWHFAFLTYPLKLEEFSFSEAYLLLHEWVSLMPNLKFLELDFDFFSFQNENLNEKEAVARALLQKKPFPQLDSLKKIMFTQTFPKERKDVIMAMYEHILTANLKISMLHIDSSRDSDLIFPSLPVQMIKFLRLKNFQLTCEKMSLKGIRQIVNFSWKLETCNLNLAKWKNGSLDSLFGFLEKFPTLKKVTLELCKGFKINDGNRKRDCRLGFLDLPNLEEFKLDLAQPEIDYHCNMIHFLFSLQFLLQCKKLKALQWSMYHFDDIQLRDHLAARECPSKIVDFRAGLRFLYESNIWDVFSSLNSVRVTFLKESTLGEDKICEHKYQQKFRGKGFSVGNFLKSHCCSKENRLHNCAILFG